MKALALITLIFLGVPQAQAQAEKTPTAIDQALLETISENQLQELSFEKAVQPGEHPLQALEETGELKLLRITTGTGTDSLPPSGAPAWDFDDIDGPQVSF